MPRMVRPAPSNIDFERAWAKLNVAILLCLGAVFISPQEYRI
jgi:hypothetical protein